ncbi:MAG: C-terminal binding protein [Planctomycetota bacterium]|nr:MAG: C-terminal binding protein [Planctomycetota bacterium]
MSQRPRVVITDFVAGPLETERKVLADIADVVALDASSEEEIAGRIEDAAAIMMYHTVSITAQTIDRLKQCKLIVRCGVGYDNVDWRLARERGIDVCNVPDYGTEEVADSAIGMMLALTRGITLFNSRLRESKGEWLYKQAYPVWRLRGRVFGIIGLGRIGTAAALRAKALGMEVVFYDPYVPDGRDKSIGVRRVETLDELLAQSHVLSPHCPLTPETFHLVGREEIAKMPAGSFLINTSRGGVVDVSAIPDALASGHLAGAGIDVLEIEPPPENDPLLVAWRDPEHPAYHRLIVNPHAAFYCEEGMLEMRAKGSESCRRALLGLPMRNVVN